MLVRGFVDAVMMRVQLALAFHGLGYLPPHDYWCLLTSLPLRFATTAETIPASVPYLHAPPALLEHWRTRLPDDGSKVGLGWASDPRPDQLDSHAIDRRRSLHASAFLPLLPIPGVTFVSLQKGDTTRPQIAELPPALRPFDLMGEVRDFADTAAIINSLDLAIAADTSVAHLAGGLGRPVWILSRFDGRWRWLRDRDDSPWYPTARLFRQTQPGHWDDVIQRIAQALQAAAAAQATTLVAPGTAHAI
ncbi:hypothetical protein [Paraburkholderia phosphatilytica]|uniref:hypothetical protein n=1 Tax=Paraburkholderia phosphatilytica TaxID=2282883 RepID=UPI000E53DFC7